MSEAHVNGKLLTRDERAIIGALVPMFGTYDKKLPYMSPETFSNHELTAAGDVFALAESLWFLATGAHPFGADTLEIVQNLVANQRAVWTGDDTLGAVLTACLVPVASERPSANDLAQRLLAT